LSVLRKFSGEISFYSHDFVLASVITATAITSRMHAQDGRAEREEKQKVLQR
jgi:hypothetical protein